MYYFGDVMYAMGMNIMKSVCVKYGQTNDTGKKFVKFDEVVKLVGEATKEPNNSGDYKDYIELMKLYDKNENGTIMIAELETMLSLLGNSFNKNQHCPKKQNSFDSNSNQKIKWLALTALLLTCIKNSVFIWFFWERS